MRAAYTARELTVRADEPLAVLEESSGWLFVRNAGGNTGKVPVSHVAEPVPVPA